MPDEAPTIATRTKGDGIRHRPIRQEPSRRPQRVSCRRCTASTSSSAISTTWTRWRTRLPPELSAATQGQGRPAQPAPHLRDEVDDPPVDPRWGKVGKQKIDDEGPLRLIRHRASSTTWRPSTTSSSTTPSSSSTKSKADGKPFFVWLNPTRMHVVTHLSREVSERCATPENGWSIYEAGMAQLDDIVGVSDEEAQGLGARRQHHRRVHAPTTAPRISPGPTAARRRSPAARARCSKAASAFPASLRWPGKVPAGKVENGVISGLDWFPTFVAAAGRSEHRRRAEEG